MNYEIIPTKRFERELKSLLKKYPSLKKEYAQLIDDIEKNYYLGEPIGNDCYKIRISIASKQKGQSGQRRNINGNIVYDGRGENFSPVTHNTRTEKKFSVLFV